MVDLPLPDRPTSAMVEPAEKKKQEDVALAGVWCVFGPWVLPPAPPNHAVKVKARKGALRVTHRLGCRLKSPAAPARPAG